jgi:hypothetical protein
LRVLELASRSILVVSWPNVLQSRKGTASDSISPARRRGGAGPAVVNRSACSAPCGPRRTYSLRRLNDTRRIRRQYGVPDCVSRTGRPSATASRGGQLNPVGALRSDRYGRRAGRE